MDVGKGAGVRSGRLPAVDGLRAAAALWVVLFHMRAFSGGSLWPGVDLLVRSGSTGVSLFLVLSGFCLYLPYAGGRTDRFRAGDFFRRRCARLMPAYYVSLAVVVLVVAVLGGAPGIPRFSPAELAAQAAAHAALVHPLWPSTFYALNGAYWSLGLEWTLYLTLPLLVVAVRRFGLRWTVLTVAAVSVAYRLALAGLIASGTIDGNGAWGSVVLPNFVLGRWSEFALGMLAAELHRGGRAGLVARRAWPLAALAGAAGLLIAGNPLKHLLFGLLFATLLCVVLAGDNVVARVFSWRPLVAVGVMSYSLYLVHQPLVEVLAAFLGGADGTDPRTVFLRLLATLPLLLGVALLLFATVEMRSLSSAGARGWLPLLLPRRRTPAPAASVQLPRQTKESRAVDDAGSMR